MQRRIVILLTVSLFGLSACALNPFRNDPVKDARELTPIGSAFNQSLYRAYLTRADEKLEIGRRNDAKYFANRARQSGEGMAVVPADLIGSEIPADQFADLEGARNQLVRLLVENGRDKAPEESAQSQSYFDCWVEAAISEDSDEVSRCRSAYDGSISNLQVALNATPTKVAEAPPASDAIRRDYKVYFGFDEWHLTAEALEVITESIETARSEGQTEIISAGHADTAGPAPYNRKLSKQRAEIVKEVMVEMGARAEAIAIEAHGEDKLEVDTGDGVAEARNRRVEISLVP